MVNLTESGITWEMGLGAYQEGVLVIRLTEVRRPLYLWAGAPGLHKAGRGALASTGGSQDSLLRACGHDATSRFKHLLP